MSDEPQITIERKISLTAGACHACTRYITADGWREHEVFCIRLRQCGFNLCPSCLDQFLFMVRPMMQKHELVMGRCAVKKNDGRLLSVEDAGRALDQARDLILNCTEGDTGLDWLTEFYPPESSA